MPFSTEISMHEPCIWDFGTDDEIYPTADETMAMLFEVEYMFTQANFDEGNTLNLTDIEMSSLHLRKSSLLCILKHYNDSLKHANIAVNLNPSAASYYRLGISSYLLSDFENSSKSFYKSQEYDGASYKIINALNVVALRCRSRKDRGAFVQPL